MKYFFTPVLILSFFLMTINTANAQSSVSFLYIHAAYSTPSDADSRSKYSEGLGFDAGLGIGSGTTYFVAGVGYNSFLANQANAVNTATNHGAAIPEKNIPDESYIPLKIGIRQYLPFKIIFVDANVGLGLVPNSGSDGESPSAARFAGDAGVGIKISNSFEVAGNFDFYKEPIPDGWRSWLVLKAGWVFNFN